MQKKLIALAIAGLSSAAFAQSNVTISGQMKVSFEGVSAGGCTAVGCTNYTSRHRLADDNSNIRFAGEENLGGGMAAFFQIESAVGTNNNIGTTGNQYTTTTNQATIGQRNTGVGLRGAWGTALMGKWDVHYNTMAAIEGNGLTDGLSLATNSLNLTQTINGRAVTGSTRDNNVIAYITPNWNGLDALIGYTTVGQSTAPGLAAKDHGWTLNPRYNNGPIALAYSYLGVKNAGSTSGVPAIPAGASVCYNPTTLVTTIAAACPAGSFNTGVVTTAAQAAVAPSQGIKVTSNKLGGAYTFPMGLKIGLIWDKSKVVTNQATGAEVHRTTWALPVSYRTGAHNVAFTYAKAGDAGGTAAAGVGANTGASMWMLGYQYDLSKRTSVGLSYTAINNRSAALYDFWHGANNVSGLAGGANSSLAVAGSDPRKFAMTVRHAF